MSATYRIFSLFLLGQSLLFTACQKVDDVAGCQFPDSLDNYTLIWSDEFDGESIDPGKWSYDLGDGCDIPAIPCGVELGEDTASLCGWGNNEWEFYTDRPENARIEDGRLIIEARKELPFYQGQHEYTSARMVTKNKGDWKYGRIDVRAKMPIGQGIWPAIWMLPTENKYGPWPCSGEIDIMEYLGQKPKEVFGTIHYGHDFWRFNSQYYELEEGTFADDFHTFTLLWTESCILFRVDGQDIGVPNTRSTVLPTTWPFDQPFHLIMNIAIGGNLPGYPDASTQFPQQMEVEYVRVYQ